MTEYQVENFTICSKLIPFRNTQEICDHIGLVIPEKPIIKETIEHFREYTRSHGATWSNGRHGSYHILKNGDPFWIYRTRQSYLRLSEMGKPVTPAVGWDGKRVPSSRFTNVNIGGLTYDAIVLWENQNGVDSITLETQLPILDRGLGHQMDTCFIAYSFRPEENRIRIGVIYFGEFKEHRVWRQLVANAKWEKSGRQNFLKSFQNPVKIDVSGVHIDPVDSFLFRESIQE